ncbi:protein of unknown function [Sterolibacterium denitrificans]|uniref:Uncharacterized protein n=1 Tax=Sterolibacterium denitrificans TaxID=157592 RepID=A0A7Z7MVY4_9PROT|nr:hypothetical protein [Sterolibacterium denitrificans]SMB27544.1 protein of unknown function [Sterolibacterium denitrificans]
MARVIKLVSTDDGTPQAESTQKLAAGIDVDIFEADIQELGGERFWEAFWKTQHTYGGVHEGQPLAAIFATLHADLFHKLQDDVERLRNDDAQMDEAERDDVFGMVMFLLSVAHGDPMYDPIEHEGYEAAMARFAAAVSDEAARRGG